MFELVLLSSLVCVLAIAVIYAVEHDYKRTVKKLDAKKELWK